MTAKLFQPIRVGRMDLQHGVVLAPLTRNRADDNHVVGDIQVEHYALRATVPGTFIISEATYVTPRDAGLDYRNIPGLYSSEQIAAWKKVVDAVHAKGSFIYCQIWTVGRRSIPEILEEADPSYPYLSAGNLPVEGRSRAPRAMTKHEIKDYVQYYASAARAAVEGAGFDGVEIHGAGGYLADEFLKNFANNRTDEYGGTPENKGRFYLEVVDAVVEAIGADRVGVKFSPWATVPGVEPEDPRPTFGYVAREIRARHPDIAFLHAVEPRIAGFEAREIKAGESNDFLREIWRGIPYIADGGYNRDSAIKEAEEHDSELVAFGRYYTSNPDLPIRLEKDIPLTPYDRSSFYTPGTTTGYNDFGFATESLDILAARGVIVGAVSSRLNCSRRPAC
ncbi:FMN-linked oxidoreductase [Amylostereum chailletii]|nr:FMN-linked oxidoreductase [Amylostereum chailletii]